MSNCQTLKISFYTELASVLIVFFFALSLGALMPPHITTNSLLLDAAKMYLHPCRWMLKYCVGLVKSNFATQQISSSTYVFYFFLLCSEKLSLRPQKTVLDSLTPSCIVVATLVSKWILLIYCPAVRVELRPQF